MLLKKQKAVARGVLLLYFLITATFELAHKDFVPLGGRLYFSPFNSISHSVDSNDNDFVCPAHNFAQSTHGPVAHSQNFSSPRNFSFIRVENGTRHLVTPLRNVSTRAPPQA